MFRLLWSHHDSIGVEICSTFQYITFNVIFGFEQQYTIVAVDCDFHFYTWYTVMNIWSSLKCVKIPEFRRC
jgi:hypothetical protein